MLSIRRRDAAPSTLRASWRREWPHWLLAAVITAGLLVAIASAGVRQGWLRLLPASPERPVREETVYFQPTPAPRSPSTGERAPAERALVYSPQGAAARPDSTRIVTYVPQPDSARDDGAASATPPAGARLSADIRLRLRPPRAAPAPAMPAPCVGPCAAAATAGVDPIALSMGPPPPFDSALATMRAAAIERAKHPIASSQWEKDSILRARYLETAPKRAGGPSLQPGLQVGMTIPVGLPGGGPSASQRRRDAALYTDYVARLARIRAAARARKDSAENAIRP